MRLGRNSTAESGDTENAGNCGPLCGFAQPARRWACRPSWTSPLCVGAAPGAEWACATERPGAG
eukprot:5465139-Lingulodinium_polyedra.AAC.1